jgi:hypothetical protein
MEQQTDAPPKSHTLHSEAAAPLRIVDASEDSFEGLGVRSFTVELLRGKKALEMVRVCSAYRRAHFVGRVKWQRSALEQ